VAQRRKKRRSSRRTTQQEYPGWLWMLFGLAIGLSVAFAVFMKDSAPADRAEVHTQQPASLEEALDDNGEQQAAATVPDPVPQKSRFDFYTMLPNFEVIVDEAESDDSPEAEPVAVEEPGVYVLQAGSFSTMQDAERRRAELAFQGIESQVQLAPVNDKTYHRVLIGPTDDLDELNMLRSRLRAAKIDVLRIRLGD
jgi:cell division protein FtsN